MYVIQGGRQQGRTYLRFRWIVERMLAGKTPMSKGVAEMFKRYDNDVDAITKALMEYVKKERKRLMRQSVTANRVFYDEFLLDDENR